MTPEQFCYWLQGRAELQPDTPPSADEWGMIREHLATVFNKVTPPMRQFTPPYRDTTGVPGHLRTECLSTC
jgi:hypothetical protein